MPRLNRCEFIGHLGADPELRYTPNQKAVANLRLAVNTGSRQPDGSWSDETLWVAVSVWDEAAERAADQLRKGHLVYAEGQLQVREYTTRDGRYGSSVELRFARVMSLERVARDEAAADAPPRHATVPVAAAAAAPSAALDVDDIPF